MTVKTRFAPSPTGYLHVGGVRTALFSWLYARHNKGSFVLRIEDTDRERSTDEAVNVIQKGMEWLGLTVDEGPFFQTERYSRYQEIIEQLLDKGFAYRCTCSKERLEALREAQMQAKQKPRYDGCCREKVLTDTNVPHVVRFKNPQEGTVVFQDEVYGEISVENAELDDFIILRTDGHPTYNFAVVIDDWDMDITHVIRGDDHISNTPRQINVFKALEAPVPSFAHLPMILGDDGKRLSKRHGAVSVLEFQKMGVLPQALLNYLVRLGWSDGDTEIFSLDDMIARFQLDNVSRGVSSFNYEKLYWLNQHYLRTDAPECILPELKKQCETFGLDSTDGPDLADVLAFQAERCQTLVEIVEKSQYFYQEEVCLDPAAVKKHLRPVILEPMKALYQSLEAVHNWEDAAIQAVVDAICSQYDLSMGKIAQPLRVAVTGSGNSPSIDKTLALIGKKRTLQRLANALEIIEERASQS